MTSKGIQGLWLRGIVSETQGSVQMSDISHVSLILLPILVLIASVGGYLIARRALTPIQRISETAKQIGQKNDLKRRIEIGDGNDEVHQLADSFNDMFEKLEKAFESERQFTSDASHELRTRCRSSLSMQYSLEKRRSAEEYEEALRSFGVKVRKCQSHKRYVDFTGLEVHKERYPMECVNLTELVSSICSDMALIRDKNISLTCETQENIETDANRELFSRLLVNLISNAYRYGKEDGHIWVRLQRKSEMIRLEVEDDGIGIEKENQKKIFQRFYQTDASRSGSGMGLGLSMAYEIAKFHNGDIVVESEKDKGSIFIVLLPC
ncbi:MAG: sensor histidine kinase [Lachnospiraceae bacterium]